MIQLRTKGEVLDLPSGFSIEIEDSNPIFNDRGSQSIPATVPATRRNIRLLDAPHRMDAGSDPNNPERTVDVVEGSYRRRGLMNITEAGKSEGITFNVGFDNSTAYAKWGKKKLSQLENLPVFTPRLTHQDTPMGHLLSYLYRIYRTPDSQKDDFAVFPVAINNEAADSENNKTTYWEVLNVAGASGMKQPLKVNRLIDGEVTEVSVPEGYMVSPFLRVWRILQLIFADLGLEIKANPFLQDIELSRLVVLNNAADSICRAEIKYADLMPDATVEEFLNALWVRFGLVYEIDDNTSSVTLSLMKDILKKDTAYSLEGYATEREKIGYEKKQYLKLSANTSIEGAAPGNERFEDFIKGIDTSKIRLGTKLDTWQNAGSSDEPQWEGDNYNEYDIWDDPEQQEPDPWDNPDDQPENDHNTDKEDPDERDSDHVFDDYTRSGETEEADPVAQEETFLAREFVTGAWYRLDSTNSKTRMSSSSYFNWDPQPEGYDALDLSGDDECVPIGRVVTATLATGNAINELCPLYLYGARHYHSYIKGSDETGKSGDETPLAFMFAYTVNQRTIGRMSPEGEDGQTILLDDGTRPKVSLMFQFSDGLFARFWKDYDEILRHGNRTVEVNCRINKLDLLRMSLLDVYSFKGIRVLIDTMTYSLPSGKEVSVDMKLRTIQTQGKYDIAKEQQIPQFSTAGRHLEWMLHSETYGQQLDTTAVRAAAVQRYIADTGYQPHQIEGGDYWDVRPDGCIFKCISRQNKQWNNDPALKAPIRSGQKTTGKYQATITYDVYEMKDVSLNPDEDLWEQGESPIGQVSVSAEYQVKLYSKWVKD